MYRVTIFFLLLLCARTGALLNGQDLQISPTPAKVVTGNGKFLLKGAMIVTNADLSDREMTAVSDFIRLVKEKTGLEIAQSFAEDDKHPVIFLRSDKPGARVPEPDEKPGPSSREAYKIKVKPGRIDISAGSDAGVFYALKTLSQMIRPEGCIGEADIEDYPALAYRGVMMDLSHGGLLTEEEIKRQIDFLASWKMNQYYLYNEVSIEMKGYPLINYNACYTQEQIRRIVAYGRERHMDVIPFVEFYGHLHELIRIEKYAYLAIGKYGHEIDPRNPDVKKILNDWIGQYAELFPGPFIHIGFDETWETERLKKENPSINPKELYMEQLNFVASAVRSNGKKVMVWTDISNNYPDIIAEFPKDIIPVLWEYSDQPESMNKWLLPVKKENLPFFVQSATDSWGNVYPAAAYTYDNIDICLNTCREKNAIGYITSVWTDAVQPLLRNTWLFMAYGCAGAWQGTPPDRKQFEENYCRIMYPGIHELMKDAFTAMSESEDLLARPLGRHTLNRMWDDPFSPYHLKNTAEHLQDYKNSRIAAETALEKLTEALRAGNKDSSFIRTMMVNCRQLDYTASRFIWAVTIVDRWNWSLGLKKRGAEDGVKYYDINYSTHGLLVDLMDICTAIKEEYRQAWLSENMEYRLGTMTGRFDADYLRWRNLFVKISEYESLDEGKGAGQRFEKIFLPDK